MCFNPKKLQYKRHEVEYMGRIISSQRIKPDPAKVKAIEEMQEPADHPGVKRLLGMVKFQSVKMSTLTSPLRSLLKKDVPWN